MLRVCTLDIFTNQRTLFYQSIGPKVTIGLNAEFYRMIKLPNGLKANLGIWDTAGQERSFCALPHV